MDEKTKVLILANFIPHYRLPILNMLGDIYDLTIAHYGIEIDHNKVKFEQIILTVKFLKPFIIFKENIYKIANNYEVVISLAEIRVLQNMFLSFKKNRSFGLIYWGIGVSASYDKKFDSDKRMDFVRMFLMKNADALLFYSEYPIKKHIEYGINKEKLFVAHNTVIVNEKVLIPEFKSHFLFVGTLYKQKKIYDLLRAYKLYLLKSKNIFPLLIVGEGSERNNIEKWILNNGLSAYIFLKGQLNEQEVLKELYKEAIACISPGQAGLTVLNALAYGVPFITTTNAITGGEILNLRNNYNGIVYDGDFKVLSQIMIELSENKNLIRTLSINAQNYYFENRTVEKMIKGFNDAIEFVKVKIRAK